MPSASSFLICQDSLRDPYFQLAWEEALALSMQEFDMKLGVRIWKTFRTIVLGISEKEFETIEKNTLEEFNNFFPTYQISFINQKSKLNVKEKREQLLIARRASGGGTVFHDHPGNLNFSLFVDISNNSELYPIKKSYDVLLGIARDALAEQAIIATTAGKSDISVKMEDGVLKKISGNAQFRKKNVIVQHGTLILSPALFDQVEKIQLHPPEEPEYRNKRSHREFLTSIDKPLDEKKYASSMLMKLKQYLGVTEAKSNHTYTETTSFIKQSLRKAKELKEGKYSDLKWILKDTSGL
ncbi:MAG: lipoate--protein ligase family protein [Leptospira sp.]|nr:lipoate--protein ligase family protein [Leptospira sp.]